MSLVPVQYVRLNNLHPSSRIHGNELCGIDNRDCLVLIEGEPLDVLCTADGYPRPALDISIDRNGTAPTIMALATTASSPTDVDIQLRSTSISEAYRIIGLIPADNGRNVTCHVDMKHIDKNLSLSSTKPLYIECTYSYLIFIKISVHYLFIMFESIEHLKLLINTHMFFI